MEEREAIRKKWIESIQDLFIPEDPQMPPLRVVNHEIPLINPNLKIFHRPPKCPEPLREQLHEKVERYLKAGWWERTDLPSTAPLMIVLKKNGTIRTVIDARQRNENTISDMAPMPDQEMIRHDVARAPFRTKLDLSDAYEQIRVLPEHVVRTVFATIFGNMISHVMQQGDKNGPPTFQRIMSVIFADMIAVFVYCYQDDVFVYSFTLESHERHLSLVFNRLREVKLYLSRNLAKIDILSIRMDCLGFIITDEGIHVDASKVDKIIQWRTPRNLKDVQKFNGMIQYLSQFLKDVTVYTTPLTSICSGGQDFLWTELHEKCFEELKRLVAEAPIINPIDYKSKLPIWVITDASARGVGGLYGQGPDWQSCRPAGFMSRKFTPAQMNYATWEHELLAVLEALLRWEDKLIGIRFSIVTDHKALTFFKDAPYTTQRRMRWWEYLSRFDYKIEYIKGSTNLAADSLSRYYSSDEPDELHDISEYVNVDARLDPEGDDLPITRAAEIQCMRVGLRSDKTKTREVLDKEEPRDLQTQELKENKEDPVEATKLIDRPTVKNILSLLKDLYEGDSFFLEIWRNTERHNKFEKGNGILWSRNRTLQKVVCVPKGIQMGRSVRGILIDAAHETLGHLGSKKTLEYIRRWFWWPTVAEDVESFCKSCGRCQTTKVSREKPAGWLHTMPIPERPWQSIGMDFAGPFVEVGGFDYILLVICRFTGMVHLIPTNTRISAKDVAQIYIKEVVRLHGIPESIVSDRDTKFSSQFWKELSKGIGQRLLMSTAYHPQTDGASERAIQTMSQILRAVVDDYQFNWVDQLPLVEFAMNSAINSSTGFAPFETNYGWMPRLIQGLVDEPTHEGIQQFIENIKDVLNRTHDKLVTQRVRQAVQANKHRRTGRRYNAGDKVYLSTKNINFPKGRASKLCPKYLGPYEILKADHETSTYKLKLPPDLSKRHIHDTFHEGLLKPFIPNDEERFPKRETLSFYEFGNDPEQEWVVHSIDDHKWSPNLMFKVRWEYGDYSWEPLSVVEELEALDSYLELNGAAEPHNLIKKKE